MSQVVDYNRSDNDMPKNKLLLMGGVLLVVVGVVYFVTKNNKPTINYQPTRQPISQNVPTTQPTIEASITPSPTKTPVKTSIKTTSSGPASGTLTCNYQIPATPNNFGTVSLDSTWSNLVAGNNGYKADLCVSTNGGATQTLMTSKIKVDGTATDDANWISLSSNYIFTLFDEHGGELPECGGIFLASCQIHTWQLPTPRPTSTH